MARQHSRNVDTGWSWLVMIAGSFAMFLMGVSVYSHGVIQIVLLAALDEGVVKITWILALAGSLYLLPGGNFRTGPLMGIFSDLTSCRTSMLVGSALMIAGYASSAFVTDLGQLYITLSFLTGIGMGFLYGPPLVALGYYFDKRLSLATSITVAGGGIGMMAAGPLVGFLEEKFGWRGMFLMLAGILCHLFIASLIIRPNAVETLLWKRRKKDHNCVENERQNRAQVSDFDTVVTQPKRRRCPEVREYVKAGSSLPVLLFCSSVFLWGMGISLVTLHLPNYLAVEGLPLSETSLLITPMGLGNLFARLLTGVIINSGVVDKFTIYCASLALMGTLTVVFPFLPATFPSSMVFATLFGMCTGGPYVVYSPISKDLVGLQYLAVVLGLQNMACGIGVLVGPVVAGNLLEISGSYRWSFVFGGIGCALSSFLGALALKLKKPNRRNSISVSVDNPGPTNSKPNV